MLLKTEKKRPLFIAGPCSAESVGQLEQTYDAIHKSIDIFRAGVWKPRTRPASFEGHGESALQWLSDLRQRGNTPMAVEVALPRHVESVLKYGIETVWLGTRTTVNPFAVQELADAISGTNLTVMIKNPMAPDLNLWIGAIERFRNAGIAHIMAIHRGYKTVEPQTYRSEPLWDTAKQLRDHFPEIPLILDPSHIAGERDLIADVVFTALEMAYDGFMIEVHPNPENALSDASQQVLPGNFLTLQREILRALSSVAAK